MKRLFLVGCPRSGTTLLQAVMAAHPSLISIPETHFAHMIRGRFKERPHIAWPRAGRLQLRKLGAQLGLEVERFPRLAVTPAPYHRAFGAMMDSYAQAHNAEGWLEKSPIHLHYIEELETCHPGANFVHIVRDGRAVCASLIELALRDPSMWLRQLDRRWTDNYPRISREQIVLAAARRWNRDIGLTRAALGSSRHHLVVYEDLTEAPDKVAADLQAGLGLEVMDLHHQRAVSEVVGHRRAQAHMQAVQQPIAGASLAKFHHILAASEKAKLTAALTSGGDPRAAVGG